MKSILIVAAALLGMSGLYAGATLLDRADQAAEERNPDVHYVPTPQPIVDAMLVLANVRDGDRLYDLGSGDGRIPITAARKFKMKKAVGIDIDPRRIEEARANAKAAGVSGEVIFRQEDLFKADFSDATVVTLYLLQSLNEKLKPRLLKELKPGTRIVSHAFTMGVDWPPEESRQIHGGTIYLWTVPPRSNRRPRSDPN